MALFVSFAYFNGNAGCEVSGPQPAILLAYVVGVEDSLLLAS